MFELNPILKNNNIYDLSNLEMPKFLNSIKGPCKIILNPESNYVTIKMPKDIDENLLYKLPNLKLVYKFITDFDGNIIWSKYEL